MSVWLEARKQEKELRKMHIDHNRRAERRKNFFDSVRKDPVQFMQLHGRAYQIHTERSVAKAAEENTIHPWAVDKNVLIDRFDARAHLDHIPEVSKSKVKHDSTEEKEEIVCDFERYRLVILNEYRGIDEPTYLKRIHQREFWSEGEKAKNIQKTEREKKKKSAETKTNIGYSYGDSEVVAGRSAIDGCGYGENSEEYAEQEIEDIEDLDAELDIDRMDPEAHRRANKTGETYGIKRSLFVNLLRADQTATRNAAELRRIERQKMSLSGRDGKSERLALKRRRNEILGGKHIEDNDVTTTLLSFVRAKDEALEKSKQLLAQAADESDSSEDEHAVPIFISTFGNETTEMKDGEEEEEKRDIQGPEFPSEQVRKIMDINRRAKSPKSPEVEVNFERRRSRSPRYRRRSRSRSGDRYRNRRSCSRSRRRSRSRSSRSRSHSRSRSRSRGLWDRKNQDDRKMTSKYRSRRSSSPAEKQRSMKQTDKDDSSDGSGSETLLEIRSSMSDSEKEKLEIENRKRRIRKTKRTVKKQGMARKRSDSESEDDKKEEARKLRLLMQKKMRKTEEQMKIEEEERRREEEKRRRLREEEILMEEEARRHRARERRLQEREEEDRRRRVEKLKEENKREHKGRRDHQRGSRRSRSRERR